MVALQIVSTESIAWLQFLCWSCRVSEWLSGGYGQGRCLDFCPFESYRATLNIETWRALTIEASPVPLIGASNVTCPITSAPFEVSGFEAATATVGSKEGMPYTIQVDDISPAVSPAYTSTAMVVYVRTETQGPATGNFSSFLLTLWSLLLILRELPLILMSVAFHPIDACKLFVVGAYEVLMAFVSGIDADTIRLNTVIGLAGVLLFGLFSVAVALPGRAIKSSPFGIDKESSHKSQQTDFPISDQIMRLQPQDQETQTSRDGLQKDLDKVTEEKKLLHDMNNDNLKKVNARIAELQAQIDREQAKTKKAEDERNEKEDRILVLEAELTKLRANNEANVSEMSAAHESKIKALEATHEQELEKAKKDGDNIRECHAELQAEIAQLEAAHKAELDKAHEEGEEAKRELEAAHKSELGKQVKQLKATHAQEKQVLEQRVEEARTARSNEITEQKSIVDNLRLEVANAKQGASDARRRAEQQHADNTRIRKLFEDQEKATKAKGTELEDTTQVVNRLQYKLDQLEGARSTEAKQRDETESLLKQEAQSLQAGLNTAKGTLFTKSWELEQAKEETARLRLQLKGGAHEQRGSSVPEKSADPEETPAPVEESPLVEEIDVREEESYDDDSLFGNSSVILDPVGETQKAPLYNLPEGKADTTDSAALSTQLSTARASNHVLKRVELEPISLLQDLNPPFQSVLEQVETSILGNQKGALIIDKDPQRHGNYLRGDSFAAEHQNKMIQLDRAMRDKANERFGFIETLDRSKEGGYRYSRRSGFPGSRRRKSIAIGETDASLLAEAGWRVPDRVRSVFKLARWSSGMSAEQWLTKPRMNGMEFERKMDMRDDRVVSTDLGPHQHRNPTDALFTAKPASTLSSNSQGLTSPASLTDILGLEDLRQQQIERGHAAQFSRLSSNALLDKSRSTWSKRQAGDLMSAKEVRVELFMKLNNQYNATKRAQDKKIPGTSVPAVTGGKTPSLSAGKPSGTPATASKSNGMYASRYAPSTTSSHSSMQTQAGGPGVNSSAPSAAPPASSAPKKGNTMNDSRYATKPTPSTPSAPNEVGSDSSSSRLDPSAASFTPSVSGKKIDMDSSKSAPSSTPSVPDLPTKRSDMYSSNFAPAAPASPAPAPSAPSAPTRKTNGLSTSMHATPAAASVSSSPAATNGGLSTSKSADTSATSFPNGPKTANGMSASRYAPKSTQSASNPSTEKASDFSGGKSAPSSNASTATPPTKKGNDMYSSRYAPPRETSVSTPTTKESDLNESKPAPSSNTSVSTPTTKKGSDMYSSRYATSSSVESSSTPVAAGTTSNSSAGTVSTAPRAQSQSGSFNAGQWGGTFNLNYARDPNEASESEDSNPRGRGRGGRGRGRGRGRYSGRRR